MEFPESVAPDDGQRHKERRLADLKAGNERRENEWHERGLCTDQPPFADTLSVAALIDVLIGSDGQLDFQLAREEARQRLYDQLGAQLTEVAERARREALTQGVGGPMGSMSTASPRLPK